MVRVRNGCECSSHSHCIQRAIPAVSLVRFGTLAYIHTSSHSTSHLRGPTSLKDLPDYLVASHT